MEQIGQNTKKLHPGHATHVWNQKEKIENLLSSRKRQWGSQDNDGELQEIIVDHQCVLIVLKLFKLYVWK